MKQLFENSLKASRAINMLSDHQINNVLGIVADALEHHSEQILKANRSDLTRMDRNDPVYDRLLLTPERIKGIAAEMRTVASLPSPLGRVLSKTTRPNGLKIEKVSVPFGVIGIIYEARPNVTCDVFALCFKAGNACILKGSRSAEDSNKAIVGVIQKVLAECEVDPDSVALLPVAREATTELLNAKGYVDLIIPRGGRELIDYVRDNSRVPVIETGAGVCHTYFDVEGDLEMGAEIVLNAKTRRVSVCNALDCMIIHKERLGDLPALCESLADEHVILYADPPAMKALKGKYPKELLKPADEKSFGMEFMDYKMAIKTVAGIGDALDHIAAHSSKHSEAIVTEDRAAAALFERSVDAACVYHNASTAFTDGAQFGMGAEIGISTQKLHARGPMALNELTSYKYLVRGDGQTRE